jgi:hypothetical protein
MRIHNAGVSRTLKYTSWSEAGLAVASLQDNRGKGYSLRKPAVTAAIPGHVSSATVAPGKFANDVLAFEAPDTEIDFLRLELPGAALGATGTFRFEIPRSMISSP